MRGRGWKSHSEQSSAQRHTNEERRRGRRERESEESEESEERRELSERLVVRESERRRELSERLVGRDKCVCRVQVSVCVIGQGCVEATMRPSLLQRKDHSRNRSIGSRDPFLALMLTLLNGTLRYMTAHDGTFTVS